MSNHSRKPIAERQPPRFLPVVDRTPQITPNYFKVVFIRDVDRTAHVPLYKWMWYSLLEVFFGEELLENLVTIASRSDPANVSNAEGKYG